MCAMLITLGVQMYARLPSMAITVFHQLSSFAQGKAPQMGI